MFHGQGGTSLVRSSFARRANLGVAVMASGKVKWFDNRKGFGFIAADSGPDVFLHHKFILDAGYKILKAGEPVIFEAIRGSRGLKAQNVQRINASQTRQNLSVRTRLG
jgi:cold shock protein